MLAKRRRRDIESLDKHKKKQKYDSEDSLIEDNKLNNIYEYVNKNDIQNVIWKINMTDYDLTSELKYLESSILLQNEKNLNITLTNKHNSKINNSSLLISFSIDNNSYKNDTFETNSSIEESNNLDKINNIYKESQSSHLEIVYNNIQFNIEVFISIISYKNFTFNLNNISTNTNQSVELNLTSEFFQKFLNKNEDTLIIIEFKISKNFQSIVNGEKQAFGYIGIINEAMTCYMNSMLQTLNIIGSFKKAVFQIPTENDDYNSVSLSLQRLFYDLMKNTWPVSTQRLVKSFGWGREQTLVQHDVQEFNLVLSDIMKKKLKGTPGDGTFSNLFEGTLLNYIQCINVNYKSEKEENFCDLQLTVKVLIFNLGLF